MTKDRRKQLQKTTKPRGKATENARATKSEAVKHESDILMDLIDEYEAESVAPKGKR